ncbi:NADPH2:quinone reductase [Chryseobacterium ginsenosidimutans]|uniref:zinc-dependent alcohol dehydrogenase family protein n=1 Tax=Chryseobacterium ginsenosidimutans TaxID=687846 RepID=UPI002786766B|nr:zinc-dependent alcohol dehydrogenase family protein [Chryseobacterium ginsenosidimutans]MDQ0593268.1 NADPH2:quinone reductase [Chryseobacterium ginsenosidimutans]
MKAIVLQQFGKPLEVKEMEKPQPKAHEVLVKIKASGLNPLDLKIKEGKASHAEVTLPMILGIDMAGIVEEIGKDVKNFKVGDEVFGMVGGVGNNPGTLAEYIAADADLLALKPKNITFKEAAATPLIFITAWEGLVSKMNIKKDETVLIHAGNGGVGHVALQIALAKGAKVFTTVKSENIEAVQQYPVEIIPSDELSVEKYVQNFTNGAGFDAILDTVGLLDDSFKAVKQYSGHVASILGWGTHSIAPLSFRNATYSGVFTLYPLLSGENRKHYGEILKEAANLFEEGKLKIAVDDKSYSLEQTNEAFADIENRISKGKTIIEIK